MSKRRFSTEQIRQLELNPHVASVSAKAIQYKGEFKLHAVLENQAGKGPIQIFTEAGFDLNLIKHQTAKDALKRWRKNYRFYGEEGLINDWRGKSKDGGLPKKKDLFEKRLEQAEANIQLLMLEVERLKKAFDG